MTAVMVSIRRSILPAFLLLSSAVSAAETKKKAIDYARDVRPILADNCFACHGPDDKARKADLRLDKPDGIRSVVDTKKPAESEIVRRITTTDKEDRMPPAKTGKVLTAAQVETLKTWVAQG